MDQIILSGQMAAAQYQYAVTDAQQLRHFGGADDNALVLLGKVKDELINFVLGTDVDTTGRVIQ